MGSHPPTWLPQPQALPMGWRFWRCRSDSKRHEPISLASLARLRALPMGILADGQWVLEQSTLTYHLSHPLHEVNGVSHAARGKGVCPAGQCDFLIAVAFKSFDSGDSNRDLHMLQVTRGGEFPLITVACTYPKKPLWSQPSLRTWRSSSLVKPPTTGRSPSSA